MVCEDVVGQKPSRHYECEDFRDLGVHVSTQLRRRDDTIERRADKESKQLGILRFIAASPASKAKTSTTKIMFGLFYGIEMDDLSDKQLGKNFAVIVDVFSCRNNNHDTECFFLVQSWED